MFCPLLYIERELKLISNITNIWVSPKEEKKIKDKGYKKHAFNVLISNRIGFRRNIPDTRNGLCKTKQPFVPISDLPTASVIICFYNEAFYTLLRTVYSVIDRTDDKLLHEIILVDDFSDDGLSQLTLNSFHLIYVFLNIFSNDFN